MSKVWDKVYNSDKIFFGEEPSNFALLCFNHMKTNDVHRILELGAGEGRDSIFFASNEINVDALDYSIVAIELLNKIAKERRIPIRSRLFDVRGPLPFQDNYFDAVYSYMLLNMRFSFEQLHFTLSEIRRVLKPRGLNFFSIRNQNDNSMVKEQK